MSGFDDGEEATKSAVNFGDLLEFALYDGMGLPRVKVVGKYANYNKTFNRI